MRSAVVAVGFLLFAAAIPAESLAGTAIEGRAGHRTVAPSEQGEQERRSEPSGPIEVPSPIEYPRFDHSLWSLRATGLRAKLAATRLERAPNDPETARLLLEVGRIDDALTVLGRAIEGDAERIARALTILVEESYQTRDGARDYGDRKRALANAARGRLGEFPAEDTARIAWRLLGVDHMLAGGGSRGYDERVERFIGEYAGTEEAARRERGLRPSGLRGSAYLEAIEAIARDATGTPYRPEALYALGWQLHTSNSRGVREPRGSDPTERFLRVLEIVEELESGIYPASEWVENAATLVTGFFASSHSVYAPENIGRVIEGYERFARDHFVLDYEGPTRAHAINYFITGKLARVYEGSAIGIAGMEDTFDRLEREVENVAAVRYLRAEFYEDRASEAAPEDRDFWMDRAIETLANLAEEGESLYHRKALATLASLLFFEHEHARALEAYEKFLDRYPQSEWAWVARLRRGQVHEETGAWEAAADAFLHAAEADDALPPSRVLGHTGYARAREALDGFDDSRRAQRLAIDAWDNDYGRTYAFTTSHAPTNENENGATVPTRIAAEALGARLAELEASAAATGGVLLERGRWLMKQRRWGEARAAFEALLGDRPDSPLGDEARRLSHRSRFESALDLGDIDDPANDTDAALREFEALSREPWTPAVGAAGLARAAILWKQGEREQAEALTGSALETWRREQRAAGSGTARDGSGSEASVGAGASQAGQAREALARDVAEIRNVVFRPRGGDLYGDTRWNGFSWPEGAARFVIVDPEIPTRLSDGEIVTVTADSDPPGITNVLLTREGDLQMLYGILDKLGGSAKREPRAIMEVPNQPVGPSLTILELWKNFFAARPGHWGGWVLETYPIISRIEFLDDDRTRAAAYVTVGYSGATVMLEKRGGAWVFLRMTDPWVT